jgi:hypothetical protein
VDITDQCDAVEWCDLILEDIHGARSSLRGGLRFNRVTGFLREGCLQDEFS